MKVFLGLVLSFVTINSFAVVSLDTQCHKVADKIDREYCHKKRMQLIRKEMDKDKGSWKKGLTSTVKNQKLQKLEAKVTEQEAFLKMLKDENDVYKEHLTSLKSARVVRPKKKKKKKDKRSDLEKALKIKL